MKHGARRFRVSVTRPSETALPQRRVMGSYPAFSCLCCVSLTSLHRLARLFGLQVFILFYFTSVPQITALTIETGHSSTFSHKSFTLSNMSANVSMTTSSINGPSSSNHEESRSHDNPDLALETFYYVKSVDRETSDEKTTKHTLKLLVNKQVLNSLPTYDKRKLGAIEVMLSPRWSSSRQAVITLSVRNDHGLAWQLLLGIFTPITSTTLTPGVFASPQFTIDLFWHLAVVCDKWNVDIKDERVAAAFKAWYAVNEMEKSENSPSKLLFAQSLLWPAWYFNHALAFQWATRHVIYNDTGHIEPYNPTRYRNIIMPKRIVREFCQSWVSLDTIC